MNPSHYMNINDDLEFACTLIGDMWPKKGIWSFRRSLLSQKKRPDRFIQTFTLAEPGNVITRTVDVPMNEFLMALDLVIRSNEN